MLVSSKIRFEKRIIVHTNKNHGKDRFTNLVKVLKSVGCLKCSGLNIKHHAAVHNINSKSTQQVLFSLPTDLGRKSHSSSQTDEILPVCLSDKL